MISLQVDSYRSSPTNQGPDFELIWKHFMASGVLFPAKSGQLDLLLDEMRQGWPILAAAQQDLFRFYYKMKHGQLTNCLSDFLDTGETYLLQHATREGDPLGTLACMYSQALTIGRDRNAGFFGIFSRPENRWPARLSRCFAEALPLNHSSITLWSYLVCNTMESGKALPNSGTEELTDRHADEIIHLANSVMDPVRVRSLGVGRYPLDLRGVNSLYEKAGLNRSRRVFGARRGGELVGMAICYAGKTPMSFSLLCNRVEIVVASNTSDRAKVIRDLVEVAAWAARERGNSLFPVLIAPADTDLALEAGLEDTNRQLSHALFSRESDEGWPSVNNVIYRTYQAMAVRKAGNVPSPYGAPLCAPAAG
ncbi:MAG: hypothetical protein ABI670_01870 [Chloroflexota bacterium]